MTRQRAARVTRGPELEAPVLLPVTQPAATVRCDDDWGPTAADLAAPYPARCCEYGGDCGCDGDDAPSAAELRWSDMEADRDAVRSAVRRGL